MTRESRECDRVFVSVKARVPLHPVCFSDDCFDRFLPRCPCPVTKREHVITRLARRWSLVVSVHTYSNPVLGYQEGS